MRPIPLLCLAVSAAAHLWALKLWLGDPRQLFAARTGSPPIAATQLIFAPAVAQATSPLPAAAHGAETPELERLSPRDGQPSGSDGGAWRTPGDTGAPRTGEQAPRAVEPAPRERAAAEATAPLPQPTTTNARTRTGPRGLGIPARIAQGRPCADLVIDPRGDDFLARAEALGMRFIVFEEPSSAVPFYLELSGPGLMNVQRQSALDYGLYSRRARDLGGVADFDQQRDRVATRYGMALQRARMAAAVPNDVELLFRAEEQRSLRAIGRKENEVRALFGSLTADPHTPLLITNALLEEGDLLEVPTNGG